MPPVKMSLAEQIRGGRGAPVQYHAGIRFQKRGVPYHGGAPLAEQPGLSQHDLTPVDESRLLRWELVLKLDDVRRGLQKWHAAASRVCGSAAADIYRGQGRALAILNRYGEMRQSELCARMNIRPQSLGEILAKLERAGYVERHTLAIDRRHQVVRITETGRACIEQGQAAASFDCFSDDEIRLFIDLLERSSQSIDRDCEAMATMPPHREGADARADANPGPDTGTDISANAAV